MSKLLEWRVQRGLTRAELGALLGVSSETIRRWENGSRVPWPRKMVEIYRETAGEVQPGDFYEIERK